jgi:SnoaL-like domain
MKFAIVSLFVVLALLAGPVRAADSVEARLAALEDRQAINNLVVGAYPRALDEGRLHDYADLFTSDGELILGSITLKGPAAIEKFLSTPGAFDEKPKPGERPKPPSPLPVPHQIPHIISNPSYTITGNTAVGGAYWTEVTMVSGHAQVIGMGRYKDELRKVNGQWEFAKREIMRDVPPPEAPMRGAPRSK